MPEKEQLELSDGATWGYDKDGKAVFTGARMGRRDNLPDDCEEAIKLRLTALRWVDGDYDQGGAYWGGGMGDHVYCGWAGKGESQVQIFVRAFDREEAKSEIRNELPNAVFFR